MPSPFETDHVPSEGELIAGRYLLKSTIGKGGMGVVWRARHTGLNSDVAVKFLYGASAASETTRKRFVTEAHVSAQLKSRHAVQVFDFGVTDQGLAYLVMELLEGESLAERLRREGSLPAPIVERYMGQAARALQRAHALGIVHRDFKPENIFVTQDEEGAEQIKVMDFGVAKLVGDLDDMSATLAPDEVSDSRKPLSRFTKTGTMLGTPFYMAPEQVTGVSVGPGADIWALGVVAYECLTGTPPFDGDDLAGLFRSIGGRVYRHARTRKPSIPSAFDAWFATACASEPGGRFATAQAAAQELSRALREPSDRPAEGLDDGAEVADERVRRGLTATGAATRPGSAGESRPPDSPRVIVSPEGVDPVDHRRTFGLTTQTQLYVTPGAAAGKTEPPAPPPAAPVRRRWPLALAVGSVAGILVAFTLLRSGGFPRVTSPGVTSGASVASGPPGTSGPDVVSAAATAIPTLSTSVTSAAVQGASAPSVRHGTDRGSPPRVALAPLATASSRPSPTPEPASNSSAAAAGGRPDAGGASTAKHQIDRDNPW